MAPPIESVLQLGFRFEPTPKQAVAYFLPRLIAGEPMHVAIRPFIHAADIYACEPGVLAAQFRPTPRTGERFFFTTCKRQPQKAGKCSRAVRVAGPGSWHSQGNSTDVKDGAGVRVGEVKKLRYKKGGAFTDWLMDEFSSSSEGSVVGDRQYVLCKIYVSPRARPDSAARQESDAAVFAPPPPEEPVAAPNKRPAPPIAEPPNLKRIRVAVVPTSPMVQPPSFPSRPSVPHRDMVTDRPSSALAPTVVPIHPVVRACHMPVQAPAPRRHPPHQPSIQASMAAPEPCSSVAARHPFCTESPALAAAQEDDDDDDFAKILEGDLEQAEEAEEEATAEANDDDTDWFAPMMTKVSKERDPFAAAIAPEENLMMPAY